MKKKNVIGILLIPFFFLFTPNPSQAAFSKFPNNPIFNSVNDLSPTRIYAPALFPLGEEIIMAFSYTDAGKREITFAQSSNLTAWSIPLTVTPISWNILNTTVGVELPFVMNTQSIPGASSNYKMWLNSVDQVLSPLIFRLAHATSLDGLTWNNFTHLQFQNNFPWHSGGNTAPTVIFDESENLYKMWYSARGTLNNINQWRIGYATSEDGIQWVRHPEPVLEATQPWESSGEAQGIGNTHVLFEDGIYHMWYHADRDIGHATSSDGIHWEKDPANPVLSPSAVPGAFDNLRVTDPFVLKRNNIYYLYYSGEDTNGRSRIGLATSEALLTPSPMPSPSPLPLPTATLTPTPSLSLFAPVILIPGFGASWNPRAFSSCDTEMTAGWKLAPYVSLYNRLIETLTKNARLQLDTDFYVYPYDWRQGLDTQSVLLKNFIDSILISRPPGTRVRLIGHSFGGLIIRSYLSNNPFTHRAVSALTVGTPHQGTVVVYPMWENGEIWTDNRLMQIAISQIIGHCRLKNTFISRDGWNPKIHILTRRETLQRFAPSVKNLLPLFDYLRENGSIKSTATLIHQNDWLLFHPFSSTFFGADFSTLSGNNRETIRFLDVTTPSAPEIRLGNWRDGKPAEKEFTSLGDGTVLGISSSVTGGNNVSLSGNHQDIISKKEAIEKILAFLKLDGVSPARPLPLPEETSTRFLTITLDVPAKLELTTPKKEKRETEENILVLFDASAGFYTLSITPSKSGQAYLHLTVSEQNEGIRTKTYSLSLSQNRPISYRLAYGGKTLSIPQLMPVFSSTF